MTAFAVHPACAARVASGAGAAARQSLGTAVFGGMLVATLLTLVLVPALYVIVEGATEWVQARLRGTHVDAGGTR
jgi:HAE1 family hydrophobic/amphiphilic exporter-1